MLALKACLSLKLKSSSVRVVLLRLVPENVLSNQYVDKTAKVAAVITAISMSSMCRRIYKCLKFTAQYFGKQQYIQDIQTYKRPCLNIIAVKTSKQELTAPTKENPVH